MLLTIIAAIIVLFAQTGILMWLWNFIMPLILHLPDITFWQAMAIVVISNILFRSPSDIRRDKK